MGYTIQALISEETILKQAALKNLIIVPLPQGMAMIPFIESILNSFNMAPLPLTEEGRNELPTGIHEFLSIFKKLGKGVYIEAEFFGGAGTQACVTWDKTGEISHPYVNPTAINSALKFIGVSAGTHQDEFKALGLGNYRNTEDWAF